MTAAAIWLILAALAVTVYSLCARATSTEEECESMREWLGLGEGEKP